MATAGERLFVATERGLFEREPAGRSVAGGPPEVTSPARFHWVQELGESRVEQLAVAPGRLVARTRDALFELRTSAATTRFRRIPVRLPGLRSTALTAGDLWVLRDEGLSRIVGGKLQAASLPYPAAAGSELFGAGGELVYSGKFGLFRRAAISGAWMPLRSGPVRTLATGSPRYPYLVESEGALTLLDDGNGAWLSIDLPYPAAETLSALVIGDHLVLGSSGFGVWQARLPQTAGDVQLSEASEAKIRR
jgi:hypothetical protein